MSAESPGFPISQQVSEDTAHASSDPSSDSEKNLLNRRQFLKLGAVGVGILICAGGERIEEDSKSDKLILETKKGSMIMQSPTQETIFDAKKQTLQQQINSEENQETWGKAIKLTGIGIAAGGAIALKADILGNYFKGPRPSSPKESPLPDQTR